MGKDLASDISIHNTVSILAHRKPDKQFSVSCRVSTSFLVEGYALQCLLKFFCAIDMSFRYQAVQI